jgi:hypothetical protein
VFGARTPNLFCADMVVCKFLTIFAPEKIDVEGFGLLATTKKMLNQHIQHTTVNLPYV